MSDNFSVCINVPVSGNMSVSRNVSLSGNQSLYQNISVSSNMITWGYVCQCMDFWYCACVKQVSLCLDMCICLSMWVCLEMCHPHVRFCFRV